MTTNKKKLAAAIDYEHPCEGDNTCDIAKAVECGYYLWAARLLSGATECPETDAAALALSQEMGGDEYEAAMNEECRLLLEEPHRRCTLCNATVWADANEAVDCGNCRATVPTETNDEE